MVPKKLSDRFFCFRFMFEKKKHFFRARFFKNPPKFTMAIPIISCRWGPGSGSRFWRFPTIFHEFSLKKVVFKVLPTHIDAEFHGESSSDGFRAIRARKVSQKLKKPKKSRQTRFSDHPSLSNYPTSDCRNPLHPRNPLARRP